MHQQKHSADKSQMLTFRALTSSSAAIRHTKIEPLLKKSKMAINSNNQIDKNNNRKKARVASITKPFIFLIVLWIVYLLCSNKVSTLFSLLYFVVLITNTGILSFLMDQELINERAGIAENTKKDDILYALLIGRIGPFLLLIITGLDNRFGWTSQYSEVIKIIAFVIMIVGLAFTDWAVIINRFFSGVVRIQKERGHKTITHGPYKFLRHPGYLGSIIYNLVTPVILSSLWGIIPALLLMIIIIVRIKKEDQYLQIELDGYKEYVEKVRYKLVPYVW